jgi:hypothetical protein
MMQHSTALSMKNIIIPCIVLVALVACNRETRQAPANETALPAIRLDIRRTELDMRAAGKEVLAQGPGAKAAVNAVYEKHFAAERRFWGELLDENPDIAAADLAPALLEFSADKYTQALIDSVLVRYPATYNFDSLLAPAFKRYRYYFPADTLPKVRTYLTGYTRQGQQTMDPYFTTPEFAGIGLHYFMGPEFKFYPTDIPKFVRRRFVAPYIPVALMLQYVAAKQPRLNEKQRPTLLAAMVHGGMRYYALDALLPDMPDSVKLAYSAAQLQYAQNNLPQIWNKLLPQLYDQDYLKYKDYVADAPFTRPLGMESPGRLGQYVGLCIVRKYMAQHPAVTLPQLLQRTDYETILKESGFRP